MRNITLALDEATHRYARITAAERGLSISGLVRELLHSIRPSSEKEEMQDLLSTLNWAASTGNFSAQDRLSREQVNDRATLRREFEAAKL